MKTRFVINKKTLTSHTSLVIEISKKRTLWVWYRRSGDQVTEFGTKFYSNWYGTSFVRGQGVE